MTFDYVVKRDGKVVPFDEEKIVIAIAKAGKATGEFGESIAKILSRITMNHLRLIRANNPDQDSIALENIQDTVEQILISSEYKKTAKAFIIWREAKRQHREIAARFHIDLIHDYVDKNDWQVKENSNMTFSLQGLHNYMFGELSSAYWLNHVYPKAIADCHKAGDFHIHDLGILAPYCCGWDLHDILEVGFTGVPGKISSSPPKHLRTALGQLVNFTFTLQGEAAGAQAVSNFDTLLAPYVKYDKLNYSQVKQAIQEFIFNINVPTRVGFQTPFFNLTMDLQIPKAFKEKPVMFAGQYMADTYGMFQEEANMINKAFCEVMIEGDSSGRIFSFPIPTYNIDEDFDWDNPAYDPIFAMAGKYGIPYFANYCGSDMDPEDARSMCPFHGNTKVRILMDEVEYFLPLRDIYELILEGKEIKTFLKGKWRKSRAMKVIPESFIKVRTIKGDEIIFEGRHIQPITEKTFPQTEKDILASEITTDMLVPYGKDDNGTIWYPVTYVEKIAPQGKDDAYCLTIEGDVEDPYFELANGLITHNCRLRIDNRELVKRGGGLFGASPKTGSCGVVTINLARIGYIAKDKEEFKERLLYLLERAKESLIIKRKIVDDFTEKGMYPYAAFYLKDIKARTGSCWANHFNTIGINGMNEACLNLFDKDVLLAGKNIGSDEGRLFALEIMDFIRDKMSDYQEETGQLFNLEATPAESTAYRLALKDRKQFPNIITASSDDSKPFYTNSTHLPVNYTSDIFELLDLQDELQTKYTGGTVIHLFLGEEIADPKVAKQLVKTVCYNYKLPYFSLTPTFSICDHHGYLTGKQEACPNCGKDTEIFSRIVGYYRPTKSWNDGKQVEFDMRKTFKVPE